MIIGMLGHKGMLGHNSNPGILDSDTKVRFSSGGVLGAERRKIEAVAMDMWPAFIESTHQHILLDLGQIIQ